MSRMPALVGLLSIVLLGCSAAPKRTCDSIIGIWRAAASESSDPRYQNPTGEMEMQFREGGVYIAKYVDPIHGVAQAQTFEGKFMLLAPDQVNISLDGKTQERYRYRFADGLLRMEHLDYPVANTLKRLDKFSLK